MCSMLFPLPTSNPISSRINIPEYLTKRTIDHRVVADWKQRPDVCFNPEAQLSATVSISEFKTRAFVDYPAIHDEQENVASINRADVGRKNGTFRFFYRHAACDEVYEERAIFLRQINVSKSHQAVAQPGVPLPFLRRKKWTSKIDVGSIRDQSTPSPSIISSSRFANGNSW